MYVFQNKYLIEKAKLLLESGNLLDIKLFQVNESFFEMSKGIWIIDGGVELKFPDGIICFGWNRNIDSFDFNISKFNVLYQDSNYIELKTDKMNELFELKNQKVIHHSFLFKYFDFVIDYTMKTNKESRLVEIKLDFEDGFTLKLSTVDYQIKDEKIPENFCYNISQELLVSLNNNIKIK